MHIEMILKLNYFYHFFNIKGWSRSVSGPAGPAQCDCDQWMLARERVNFRHH